MTSWRWRAARANTRCDSPLPCWGLRWQTSDPDPAALGSIAAHARAAGLTNLLPPVAIDACARTWPVERADALVCINMIHIAPWAATEGLMAGAGRLLPEGGPLYLYGPFRIAGRHAAASNARFDENLRARDPDWGVRDLDAVLATASAHGLRLDDVIAMPANNLSLILRKVRTRRTPLDPICPATAAQGPGRRERFAEPGRFRAQRSRETMP